MLLSPEELAAFDAGTADEKVAVLQLLSNEQRSAIADKDLKRANELSETYDLIHKRVHRVEVADKSGEIPASEFKNMKSFGVK